MKLINVSQCSQVSGGDLSQKDWQKIDCRIAAAAGFYIGMELFGSLAMIGHTTDSNLRNMAIMGNMAKFAGATVGAAVFGLTSYAYFALTSSQETSS